jgi:glycerol-3-phosphate acyltransferase PlsY
VTGPAAVVLAAALAFAAGAIPVGLLVNRAAAGVDIREYGTGNIGASNTFRNVGLAPAALVGVAAFAQGYAPARLAGWAWGDAALAAAAVAAVAGYAWSPLLGWRGGSAVGTATGALAAVDPRALVVLLALYAVGAVLRQPAPGVLAGLVAFPAAALLLTDSRPLLLAAGVVPALVIVKRLDGVGADLRRGLGAPAVLGRLVFDRRPGRSLTGRIRTGG